MTTASAETTEPRTRWSAVVAVAVAVVLVALDMTIVAVALPALGEEFGAPPAAAQWVLLGYFLPLVALSIPAGRWLDRAGTGLAFQVAVAGLGLASVLAALAPSLPALVAARVGQGVFGSVISVIAFPVVAAVVRPQHRGRAISIILTLIPLSSVVGPVLGGALTELYGWRAVFVINVPIVVLAALLGRCSLPRGDRAGSLRPDLRSIREAVLLGVAAIAVFDALGLVAGDGGVLLPALLGVFGIGAVVWWARLPEASPVLRLLRSRELVPPLVGLPLMTTVVGAINFLVPYFVITALVPSPQLAGLALAAIGAAMALGSPLAGVLADRIGPRPLTLAGAGVTLLGVCALLGVDGQSSAVQLAWPLAVIGLGQGLYAGPNSLQVLAATPPELAATAGGITSVLRTFGFSLGPALAALTWVLAGGGAAGFGTGVAVLIGTAAAAFAVTAVELASRRSARLGTGATGR